MTTPYHMKKVKRATAADVQTLLMASMTTTTSSTSDVRLGSGTFSIADIPKRLVDMLDNLLDPRKAIDDLDTIDWLEWLMAGGRTPDDFRTTVRQYDNATTCGLVWTADFVAYRCRTCGISPCMSLCANCFQQGDHEGHDFNMFRSQAGGACDCGDTNVMKETGFCNNHGPRSQMDKPSAPRDLLCVTEAVLPWLLLRLVRHLRERSTPLDGDSEKSLHQAIVDADPFLKMLHEMSQLGAAMRGVMTQVLINSRVYKNMTEESSGDPDVNVHLIESNEKYKESLSFLRTPMSSKEYDYPALKNTLHHRTFLDELVFWMVMFKFPQKLVCFLLNMLPDNIYKEAFTRAFVQHYSRISVMMVDSMDSDLLSNRIVHVSIQLFSNEALALLMAKEMHLLHIMVLSVKSMIKQILIPSTLHDPAKNHDFVVDCNQPVMKQHCYWLLVSDLNNVLSHKPLVLMFIGDSALLKMWFSFLSFFQGMNVNQRELSQHVKFEPNTYYAAFSAELEASASILWALLAHVKDPSTIHLTKNVLNYCLDALVKWFDALGIPSTDLADPYRVSFHLPLHRYFAVFMGQAVKHQNAKLSDILPSVDVLQDLLIHPLKSQIAFYEILCGMWVRNGLQMKGQAMTYIQCHFCNYMVDADLFLLQVISTQVDPDWFVMSVLERFHVLEWLSFDGSRVNSFLETEQEMSMLEGALTFFAMLFSLRTNIGPNNEDLTKHEMVTLLCMADRTHSQLIDLMPEKSGSVLQNKDFEATLAKVADYKGPNFEAGGNMVQGTYVPKAKVWEQDFDPIYILLRAINRRDYQSSIDRFAEFTRQSGKSKDMKAPWAPFRIPGPVHNGFSDPRRLLHCRSMHSVIFTILYKAVHDPMVSEMIMSLCIYLLDMTIRYPASEASSGKELLQVSGKRFDDQVHDLQLKNWFDCNFIFTNLHRKISRVYLASGNSEGDGMEVDNYTDLDTNDVTSMETGEVYDLAITEEAGLSPADSVSSPQHSSGHPLALPAAGSSQALVPLSHSSSQMMVIQSSSSTSVALRSPSTISGQAIVPSDSYGFMPSNVMLPLPAPSDGVDGQSASSAIGMNEKSSLVLHQKPRQLKLVSILKPLLNCESSSFDSGDSNDLMKALEPPLSHNNYVVINESMMSLLLKLHSKLSGKPDSYVPPTERPGCSLASHLPNQESRIGDGPHFISLLLDKICQLSIQNARLVQDLRNCLWPSKATSNTCKADAARDASDKEERSRKARERQEKLMAEFASRQRAFMETSQNTSIGDDEQFETDDKSSPTVDDSVFSHSKKYSCSICGQTTTSTESNPVGLVCLIQASSILGQSVHDSTDLKLPCTDDEKNQLSSLEKRAAFMSRRIDELGRNFSDMSRLMAVNIGFEGGIHIWTCGHHLHLDCHKSYIQSLKNQQSQQAHRQQSLAVDKGEYSCPLCRQLANTVLPITSDIGEIAAVVKSLPSSQKTLALELLHLINSDPPTPRKTSNLMKAMGSIMEDMANATYPKYKFCTPSQCAESLFLFISSVARTNLEFEIVQKGGVLGLNSETQPTLRPCFMPLLHVLGMHSKMLNVRLHSQLWPQITGLSVDGGQTSLSLCEKEVPLLLRDMTALLLQLVLTLPMHIDRAYFSCITRMLYNIICTQTLAMLTCRMSEQQRLFWKDQGKKEDGSLTSLASVVGLVVDTLEHCYLYLQDDDMDVATREKQWTLLEMETVVRRMCLPFLRITALLKQQIYKENFPTITENLEEFELLANFLGLLDVDVGSGLGLGSGDCGLSFSSASCLTWISDDPSSVVRGWCHDFMAFVNVAQIAARSLLDQHMTWHTPRLLRLPHSYDRIFQRYHQRPCSSCNLVPKDPSLCLLCARLVCLKERCCWKQSSIGEAVNHSVDCGAGTSIFLAVNSSMIIVIRGKRACLWGSVYLDSYGEEDRDLKRGKPLYLSEERYRLLEKQWLTHSFDHTNKRWIWHKGSL